jgi:retron-type reverse transcriptase
MLEDGVLPQNMEKGQTYIHSKVRGRILQRYHKYRPITLINTAAKVLEKLLINRIMYHIYSNNLMSKNQYGFTPQTSTVDAVMTLKGYVQDSVNDGHYVAVISLDVKGAFDAAWWLGIMASLRNLRCPGNLYRLSGSYFSERTAF